MIASRQERGHMPTVGKCLSCGTRLAWATPVCPHCGKTLTWPGNTPENPNSLQLQMALMKLASGKRLTKEDRLLLAAFEMSRGGKLSKLQEMSASGLLFWSLVSLALVMAFVILALTAH